MGKEKLIELRDEIVDLRTECLGQEMDVDGSIILSYAIQWFNAKIEGKPFKLETVC